ncbi:hypothetical protein PHMEG_00012847 [Phytophthora megakarya]|uniref:Uncharacterized protein n=1 Tax=Phytophthora megakarya TaxID=4795 RepID=A0A225W7R7_9STRA|nr:hypothetical protein PHMEG_00012847 [Phytophthora megakarya]
MVRVVPGSSGDSQGFHHESNEDATKIKLEPGIEASAEGGSSQTLLSEAGYTQSQSAGRSSENAKEEEVTIRRLRLGRRKPTTTPPTTGVGSKKNKTKARKAKRKVPNSDAEDRDGRTWTEE